MGKGQEVMNQAVQYGKYFIKKEMKKWVMSLLLNPYFYVVIAIFLLIIIIAGTMVDVNSNVGGNSGGMSGVSGSMGSYKIDVYNDDGTVNEEKILELQLSLETEYNLVTADTDINTAATDNIGGQYNKESCEKVRGIYLGFDHWDESDIPRSKLGGIVYQCPWWANGRASEVNNKRILISGNAKDMYDNASSTYSTGQVPKENSLVIYNGGDYGHVAFVEAVDTVNKYYYITHAGSGKSWFGIQKIAFDAAPWSGYSLKGFVYVGE